jgi:alpha-tubulin suppressor-like RCC1 family protein
MLAACGGGGGGGDKDWYYHFICNGDSECLSLNPLPDGTESGTLNQGPGQGGESSCNSLLTFGNINWNIPPAQQWCDHSSGLNPPGGFVPTISGFTPSTGAPGDTVTITGTHFPTSASAVTVTIAGVQAAVTNATSTQLTVTVPTMGNATGPIVVTTSGGSATSADTFSVVVPNPLGTSPIKKIAPGYTHACAILADDSVKCWGTNDFGQLGDGGTSVHTGAVTVAGVSNPLDIAVGRSFSCGIFTANPGDASGPVRCWGKGTSGQLGDNSNASSASTVAVSSITNAIQISARANHACAVLSTGYVKCWGEGTSGQLGNNALDNSPVPVTVGGTGPDNYDVVDVNGNPAVTKAFQVSAGDEHTCARVSSSAGSAGLKVKCWGATNHGELGNGAAFCQVNTICDPKGPNPNPQYVSNVTFAAQLAAGAHHTCVLMVSSGNVRCWGEGSSGQLGANTYTHSSTFVTVYNISGSTAISSGSNFSCAEHSSALKCWGANDVGQLGNGTNDNASTPQLVTVIGAGAFTPASLMGGDKATCMKLAADDTAFCFP